jgi:hypothetical protein
MKKYLLLIIFAFICANAFAQVTIDSKDAKDHIGDTAYVKGKVSGVKVTQAGKVYINFDNPYPDHTFTAVIFDNTGFNIGDISEGKTLTIYGVILLYKEKPEIILNSQEQIIKVE